MSTDNTITKTDLKNILEEVGSIGGSNNLYIATYGTTTSAEIETAYQANKCVCVFYNNRVYTLQHRQSATKHYFSSWDTTGTTHYNVRCDSNAWSSYYSIKPSFSDIPSHTSDLVNDSGFITESSVYYAPGTIYLTTDLSFDPYEESEFQGGQWVNWYADLGARSLVVVWECVDNVYVGTLEFQDSNYQTYTLYFPFDASDTWANYVSGPHNYISTIGMYVFEIDYDGYLIFNTPYQILSGAQEEVYLNGSRVSQYDTIETEQTYQSEFYFN